MSTLVTTEIDCDGNNLGIDEDCYEIYMPLLHGYKPLISKARRLAKKDGWSYTKIGGRFYDLCPDCTAKANNQ